MRLERAGTLVSWMPLPFSHLVLKCPRVSSAFMSIGISPYRSPRKRVLHRQKPLQDCLPVPVCLPVLPSWALRTWRAFSAGFSRSESWFLLVKFWLSPALLPLSVFTTTQDRKRTHCDHVNAAVLPISVTSRNSEKSWIEPVLGACGVWSPTPTSSK